ncbi:hypothetical protein HWV62_27448 [Athelia sp. TMB]|nr:hypothetical protein HWV62_27884 [Athelia sp. TMB]KAF7969394.1 hypothetical protein HWV62_27448 [Athelia sp. TMB]
MSTAARSRNQKKVARMQPQDEGDEEQDSLNEMPMSQGSMSSSDADLVAVVAQQMKAASEKKRKDKDKRFLQFAEKELNKTIVKKQEEFAKNAEEIADLFENFVVSYASAEDDIRKIWVKIQEEQKTLLNIVARLHTSAILQSSEREQGQLKGLANVKRACEDSQKLLEKLVAVS